MIKDTFEKFRELYEHGDIVKASETYYSEDSTQTDNMDQATARKGLAAVLASEKRWRANMTHNPDLKVLDVVIGTPDTDTGDIPIACARLCVPVLPGPDPQTACVWLTSLPLLSIYPHRNRDLRLFVFIRTDTPSLAVAPLIFRFAVNTPVQDAHAVGPERARDGARTPGRIPALAAG